MHDSFRSLGWAWFAVFCLLGLLVALAPLIDARLSPLIEPGHGTALQLVAAVIFLAAIIPSLLKENDWLVICSTGAATMFGIIGTWVVLEGENSYLAWLVFAVSFAALYAAGAYLLLAALIGIARHWLDR